MTEIKYDFMWRSLQWSGSKFEQNILQRHYLRLVFAGLLEMKFEGAISAGSTHNLALETFPTVLFIAPAEPQGTCWIEIWVILWL